jgi:hypothetical protein
VNKQQLIIECWERTGKDSAGASELAVIQEAIAAHFGAGQMMSPASIARTLADHGVRLKHPEILEADRRWREQQQPFAPEDLNHETLTFIERLERGELEPESVREAVRQLKSELQLLASTGHELAKEYVQWLTIWLQNPGIFGEWVALRKNTLEFQKLREDFSRKGAKAQRSDLREPEV